MKVNKLISKGLSVGLLLNSLSILSYANTEIPNRYQTLEGEYITIDDSMGGNLEEIEIFGNTVQDKNNLEDIQSVGDLYVDENGNPILDSQGREQYEIDILSQNKNLSPNGTYYENWKPLGDSLNQYSLIENGYILDTDISRISYNKVNLKDGETYTISLDVNFLQDSEFNWIQLYWFEYNNNNNHSYGPRILKSGKLKWTFTYNKNLPYLGIYFDGEYENNINENLRAEITNIQIEKGALNSEYEPTNNHATSILLPVQLQRVKEISDKLYWDDNRGRYIIEKNIGKKLFDGHDDEIWYRGPDTMDCENFKVFSSPVIENLKSRDDILSTYFEGKVHLNTSPKEGVWIGIVSSSLQKHCIRIKIDESKLDNLSIESFKKWLNLNPTEVYYYLLNSQYIETNITSKLKIPTYDEKTHIYVSTENGINPTLKVTVDRLPQIAKEAIIQAENDNTNHNIALARMYINMLPESLYKDQLQEQLSEVFSSDVVLDKKTATSNLDLYIKCENILMMSLSTNSITFEDFSGVEDMTKENAVQISINSSLPYSLNAYLPIEIQNSDKSVTMDKDILNIKENSESTYQTFANTTDKIILKDNNLAGNDLIHNIDIKLKGGIAHEKDVYKTTIKFEAEQK